jgi:citrate lyase beta subunit
MPLRHGLSLPLTADPAAAMKARQIAQLLAPEAADELQMMAALEMAQAHVQLLRVAAVRRKLMAGFEVGSMNLAQVRRLAALDRYERQALIRRGRAVRKLSAAGATCTDRRAGGVMFKN